MKLIQSLGRVLNSWLTKAFNGLDEIACLLSLLGLWCEFRGNFGDLSILERDEK